MNRIGIDIGNVLVGRFGKAPQGEDTAFLGEDLAGVVATPPMPYAFEAVRLLHKRFSGRIWLVSKCYPKMQRRSLLWLEHSGFYDHTKVPPEMIRFCRERSGKAPICESLGITHFIDDRAEVHEHLAGVVPHRFLFGGTERPPRGVMVVLDWLEALDRIEPGLADEIGNLASC